MLRIAICDDMLDELGILISFTNQYISTNNIEAEVMKFSNAEELINVIESERFHIYILDVVMPMISGLELGREIRRFDNEAQIIYATTEPQFALQAYVAMPINYLIKPINKQQFFDTLEKAISKVELAEEQTFNVKTADSLRIIKLSNILCCEYRNHVVIFSLSNGEKVASCTIRKKFPEYVSPILKDKYFLQCHSSFVINMRWVERFYKDRFMLFKGEIVSISAKQYPIVRDTYMDYLMGKGGDR